MTRIDDGCCANANNGDRSRTLVDDAQIKLETLLKAADQRM
jgi:hypothetical protein